MPDDRKHSEAVKVWLTERELLDLSREAAREDRKLSDLIRVVMRRYMYGHIGCPDGMLHGANSPDEGRE